MTESQTMQIYCEYINAHTHMHTRTCTYKERRGGRGGEEEEDDAQHKLILIGFRTTLLILIGCLNHIRLSTKNFIKTDTISLITKLNAKERQYLSGQRNTTWVHAKYTPGGCMHLLNICMCMYMYTYMGIYICVYGYIWCGYGYVSIWVYSADMGILEMVWDAWYGCRGTSGLEILGTRYEVGLLFVIWSWVAFLGGLRSYEDSDRIMFLFLMIPVHHHVHTQCHSNQNLQGGSGAKIAIPRFPTCPSS